MVREYPPLRPLTMVMKVFLVSAPSAFFWALGLSFDRLICNNVPTSQAQRRLNDTYSGGIGSFVLCAMIVSFLQMRKRLEIKKGKQLSWNLGALLVEIFHLYGNTFNYMHTGISIRDGGFYFRKREKKDWENPNR